MATVTFPTQGDHPPLLKHGAVSKDPASGPVRSTGVNDRQCANDSTDTTASPDFSPELQMSQGHALGCPKGTSAGPKAAHPPVWAPGPVSGLSRVSPGPLRLHLSTWTTGSVSR